MSLPSFARELAPEVLSEFVLEHGDEIPVMTLFTRFIGPSQPIHEATCGECVSWAHARHAGYPCEVCFKYALNRWMRKREACRG